MTDTQQPANWLLARPAVTPAEAASLAATHFGVTGAISEAGSQQDRNFFVRPETGPGILLKINNPVFTAADVSLQQTVSECLLAADVATPKMLPVRDAEEQYSAAITLESGAVSQLVAFELISGTSFVEQGHSFDGALAEQLGELAGQVVAALADLTHPHASRTLQWELGQAPQVVADLLHELPEDKRELCAAATQAATAQLRAVQRRLPRQIIHGDLTGDNLLRGDDGKHYVVDLGDAAYSWRVAELAVLLADVLGATGDLAIVGRAVRGFCTVVDLTDAEFEALWPLVILRGAVLAVSGYSQLRIDPENDYASSRMDHEWQVFTLAAAQDHAAITAQLRLAAGLTHEPGLRYHPLLAELEQAVVVDLSTTSRHMERGRWLGGVVAEQQLVQEALQAAPVAVLRFGESRLTRATLDVTKLHATKARFAEVAARSGATVYAPFSGQVREVTRAQSDSEFAGASTPGAVELETSGVVLRLDGLAPLWGLEAGTTVAAGQVVGRIAPTASGFGSIRVTRRVPGTAVHPDVAVAGEFAVAGEEYETSAALSPAPLLGVPAAVDPQLQKRREQARRDRAMPSASERYYADPPQIERGWGARLIDTEGRVYLDMVNNVTAIGHSHPRLAEAVSAQLETLNTNSRFLYTAYADFTERLLEHSPSPELDTVIPVNSGSEAIDLALKLARAYTGRKDIIALREAYHGWTHGADSISTSAYDNPYAIDSRPDWVHLATPPNDYRGPHRGADAGQLYAAEVAEQIAEMTAAGQPPAAFICEPVLGNSGGVRPPAGYLSAVYEAVRAAGGVAIADEVQVGYGRLGKTFWGCELQDAVPDIIAVAKAAGNAFPFGAVLTRREIVDALVREGMFFSSAAGAPASAVAGTVVLDVIRDENLQHNADLVGEHLLAGLDRLAAKHPLIGAVHGSGLYLGIELVEDRRDLTPAVTATAEVCNRMLKHGLIVQATSERQNVLKVKPPLVLTTADADVFLAALDTVLTEIAAV
ncbi:aminotransferase [Leucobacter sp. OH2974_COT-288]|nr:aminotransferase [Leucobacter sp. OH2974_COT-288]